MEILIAQQLNESYTLRTVKDYRSKELTFEALTDINTGMEIDYFRYAEVRATFGLTHRRATSSAVRPKEFLEFE